MSNGIDNVDELEGVVSAQSWIMDEQEDDTEEEGGAWVMSKPKELDSLLDFVSDYDIAGMEEETDEPDWFLKREGMDRLDAKYPPPWASGYELRMVGVGGMQSEERRRIMILPRTLRINIQGDLDVNVEEESKLRAEWSSNESISGKDSITVGGGAEFTWHARNILITHGGVNRIWTGQIRKYIGQDGVICLGLFARLFTGASMTMSALVSGDVYGGAAKSAAARVYIFGFGYRAAKAAAWLTPAYIRLNNYVIEPATGTAAGEAPTKSYASKAAQIIIALCPFLEILSGMAAIPIGIFMAVLNKVRKKKPIPPVGPPRIRTIKAGYISYNYNLWSIM